MKPLHLLAPCVGVLLFVVADLARAFDASPADKSRKLNFEPSKDTQGHPRLKTEEGEERGFNVVPSYDLKLYSSMAEVISNTRNRAFDVANMILEPISSRYNALRLKFAYFLTSRVRKDNLERLVNWVKEEGEDRVRQDLLKREGSTAAAVNMLLQLGKLHEATMTEAALKENRLSRLRSQ